MIPLAEPSLDGNEAQYVHECLDSGFVSSVGPFVDRFEKEFAYAIGGRHAVACSSGTAALHVALRLAGAEPGRLVAVSDFTFIASANAIAYTGADVLLVDSEPATWNMDTELLYDEVIRRDRCGQRLPDVIEVVHVLGHPAHMEPLLELRARFDISIVEDAAEALGAKWVAGAAAGQAVGTVGDIGCFSFNGNKTITSGGGGMIVTPDPDLARRAKHLCTQAKVDERHYHHNTVGYNYRLSNLSAALGLAQLERLHSKVRAKRSIASRYDVGLVGLPVDLPPRTTWAHPSFWLYSLLVREHAPDPDELVTALASSGIQTRPLWPPIHRQAPYRSAEVLRGEVADRIYDRGLSLPSSPQLTESEQTIVIKGLQDVLG